MEVTPGLEEMVEEKMAKAAQNGDWIILENLHLVDELPARGLTAVVAPMKVEGAPEAPARVFAS